jgi:hypothetical protein
LTDAVADSSNWRNVMRKLGLNATSAGVVRIVRRDVERLGLDTSHFRGKRIWSDAQLRRAVMNSHSWDELLDALGLAPGSGDARIRVKAHAIRLGLDLSLLENPLGNSAGPAEAQPDLRYLRDAATSLAASWFSLCGFSVAIPAEPTVYDLLVDMQEGIKRVQVKTTTCCSKDGWAVVVGRRSYSAVDGDLAIYLIPSRIIAGRVGILLHTYTNYIVGSAAGLMAPAVALNGLRRAGERPARDVGWRTAGVDCPVCQLKENTSRAHRRGYVIKSSCTRVQAEPRARRCGTPACRW